MSNAEKIQELQDRVNRLEDEITELLAEIELLEGEDRARGHAAGGEGE